MFLHEYAGFIAESRLNKKYCGDTAQFGVTQGFFSEEGTEEVAEHGLVIDFWNLYHVGC